MSFVKLGWEASKEWVQEAMGWLLIFGLAIRLRDASPPSIFLHIQFLDIRKRFALNRFCSGLFDAEYRGVFFDIPSGR